jgi:hypothetical protein
MVCLRSDYSKPFFILLTPPLTNSFTVSLVKDLPWDAVLMGSVVSTICAPVGIQTPNLLIRSQVLYPIELPVLVWG